MYFLRLIQNILEENSDRSSLFCFPPRIAGRGKKEKNMQKIHVDYRYKNRKIGNFLIVAALLFLTIGHSHQLDRLNAGTVSRTLQTLQSHECDGGTMRVTCPDRTVISIQYAKYGRSVPSSVMCPAPTTGPALENVFAGEGSYFVEDTNCIAVRSLEVMLDLCEDRSNCAVRASPDTFTQDPCQGTPKYLELHYKCRPNEYERLIACEGDELQISCAKGGIAIYSAMFGRTPNGTDQCPPKKHGYIDCQAPDTVSEVRSLCHGKKYCSIQSNESIFGDPCPDGTNKYLSVTYACVPRKILKPMHGKTNHRKKKKKKKKGQGDPTKSTKVDNITEMSVTQDTMTSTDINSKLDTAFPEVFQSTGSPSTSSPNHFTTTETNFQNGAADHDKEEAPEVSSVHESSRSDHDAPFNNTTTVNDESGAYYKSFEDVTLSELLLPGATEKNDIDDMNQGHVKSGGAVKPHSTNFSDKSNVDQSNSVGSNSHQGSHLDSKKESVESSSHDFSSAKPTPTHRPKTTLAPFLLNNSKDHTHKLNQSHIPGPSQPVDKTGSTYVIERNLTVLCSNHTPDVRWGGIQKPADQFTIGFLKDWFSICHYLKTQEEKAWLYFTLGICFGIIVMLVVVLVKVCFNFRRNIRARLDVSEPTHRSALINNHSSLDAPMLEHSDSMDRIEVVRFSPRNTLRSLRSDSHNRDLVNYYG